MDAMASAWHAGEVAAQRRYGLDERLAEVGRQVVRAVESGSDDANGDEPDEDKLQKLA